MDIMKYELARIANGQYVACADDGKLLFKTEPMSQESGERINILDLPNLGYEPCVPHSVGGVTVAELRKLKGVEGKILEARDHRLNPYPKDRYGNWIPIKASMLKQRERFMVHPQDQFVYEVNRYENDVLYGRHPISGFARAQPIQLIGEAWVWVEVS